MNTRSLATLTSVLLFTGPLLCPAAVYYVRPGGDDAADGLTEQTAWKTVAKVNASAFHPGDQILFVRGGEWRESLVANSDGTADQPILYAAYGKGEKPKFWGSDVLANSRFQPVSSTTYKYVFDQNVDRHMGVAVNHELLPWDVLFGKPQAEMIAAVENTPRGYWIDDGTDSTKGNNVLYLNTAGSDPRTDGKLYTICARQDVIQNFYKSHITFRDLVSDESARLELGYGFRIAGGSDIHLENCEACRAGVANFGIINAGVVGDHLKAAYAIPHQHQRNSAFLINNSGTESVQLLDCTASHLESLFPASGNYDALECIGTSTGNVLIKNLTCTTDGGGGITVGTNATVKIIGGTLDGAHTVIYSNNVLVDGLTLTGNSCIDLFGSDNVLQNCKLTNLNPQHGGPSGYTSAIVIRDKARQNTIRFCTVTFAADAPGNSACLTLTAKDTATRWFANIFLGNPLAFNGTLDSPDLCQADFNLYRPGSVFTDAGVSLAKWQAAGFDPHSLLADPMFVDAPGGNFSLDAKSPAVSAANVDPSQRPLTDAAGNPRPASGACSIGALEPSAK